MTKKAPDYLRLTFDYHGALPLMAQLRAGIDPDMRGLAIKAADMIEILLDQFCRVYPAFKDEHLRRKYAEAQCAHVVVAQ